MYLIHPAATSVMWMNPSRKSPSSNGIASARSGSFARAANLRRPLSVGYSSSQVNAPKFFTLETVQTTSSPGSGNSIPRGISLHRPEDLPLDLGQPARRLRHRGAAHLAGHRRRRAVEHDLLRAAVLALHLEEPPAGLGEAAGASVRA